MLYAPVQNSSTGTHIDNPLSSEIVQGSCSFLVISAANLKLIRGHMKSYTLFTSRTPKIVMNTFKCVYTKSICWIADNWLRQEILAVLQSAC